VDNSRVKGAERAAGPAGIGAAEAVKAMPDGTSPQAFLRGLVVRTAALLAAAACLNLFVNPFGTYGTHVFEPIILTSRRPKLNLYEHRNPAPAIVVLGSSRSFSMEPSYIEARTSRPAFNAAMHAAGPQDYLDMARCYAAKGRFPSTLIVGLGVEQLITEPVTIERHDPLASCSGRDGESLSAFLRAYRGLFTLEETWASLRLFVLDLKGARPAPLYRFAADGAIQSIKPRPLDQAVDESLSGNWQPSEFDRDSLNSKRVEQMRQLLELCRDRGARVIVYLPPYHPRATARYLRESRFASLRALVLGQLGAWTSQYPVRFYDFTELSSFGGRDDMFYDASHPREDAFRLMVDRMLADLT
jgi:hypothetical protein